jgi:GH25 family lysozyme M1 (1,4-beta-N-acetylmuramidase)
MSKTIMDVSRHQGTIDWAKVKASGKIDGVMLRAMGNSAEGKPSKPYTDPQFARNYAECKRLGIPCGVYGYFKATNKAQADKELAMLRKLLAGKTLQLPVAVDIEDKVQQTLSKSALTDIAAHCLSTVESWGVYALLYTGLWFGQTYLYMGGAALKAYDVWLARYPKDQSKTKPEDKPKTAFTFGMWQYTSTAHIPGVVDATPGKVTNVDLSHAYKDYATIIQRARLGAVRR